MEVNDLTSTRAAADIAAQDATAPKTAESAQVTATPTQATDVVTVETRSNPLVDLRVKANDLISTINVASQATQTIDKLVSGVLGIVDQAEGDIPVEHRAVLEQEANSIVAAIRSQADVQGTKGVKPLSGDAISLEIESELGKTLDILLPDGARNGFGIGVITFSQKDAIIQTRAAVAKAREQIDGLRKAIADSADVVRSTVQSLDVSIQNREAARSAVRDVDKAVTLAGDTKDEIGLEPGIALSSFRAPANAVATLLA